MKRVNILSVAFLALTASFLNGCSKQGKDSVMAAANCSLALVVAEDIRTQVHMAISAQPALFKTEEGPMIPQCASVSLQTTGGSYPKILTITYGDGCTDNNGKTRRGSLVCVISGPVDEAGTIIDIAPVGYKIDQYTVTGNQSVSVGGPTGPYQISTQGINVSWGESTVTWNGDRSVEWAEGASTTYLTPDQGQPGGVMGYAAFADDMWHITAGSGAGNDRDGHPYTYQVSTHLHLMAGCWFVTEGRLKVHSANRTEGEIDFGSGECDPQAYFEADGDRNNFILP